MRPKGKGGKWSEARSFVVKAWRGKRRPRVVSPRRPLLFLHTGWHEGEPKRIWGRALKDWRAILEEFKPFCALRLDNWANWERSKKHWFESLSALDKMGAKILWQVAQNVDVPLPDVERAFKEFPNLEGVLVCERGVGPHTSVLYHEIVEYHKRLMLLTKGHGKLFLSLERDCCNHTWLIWGRERDLFETARRCSESVVLCLKMNIPICPHLSHSSSLGLWLVGACQNWGVDAEAWYWATAGYGFLGEAEEGNVFLFMGSPCSWAHRPGQRPMGWR